MGTLLTFRRFIKTQKTLHNWWASLVLSIFKYTFFFEKDWSYLQIKQLHIGLTNWSPKELKKMISFNIEIIKRLGWLVDYASQMGD